MTVTAITAAEWADDLTTMMLTYSPNPADIEHFARNHGVIAGIYVEIVEAFHIVAENGWEVHYDTLARRWNATA